MKKNKQKMVRRALAVKVAPVAPAQPLKLDLGCGPNKCGPDWIGVDALKFPGVDMVVNLAESAGIRNAGDSAFKPWPWKDESVDEIYTSHFIEHLDGWERAHFVNEAYRVLKPGSSMRIVVPDWSTGRAYGDPTHKWPPVSNFWFNYLSAIWRWGNAPHTDIEHNSKGYKCNFAIKGGFTLRQDVQTRNAEYQMYAQANYIEVRENMFATFEKTPYPAKPEPPKA